MFAAAAKSLWRLTKVQAVDCRMRTNAVLIVFGGTSKHLRPGVNRVPRRKLIGGWQPVRRQKPAEPEFKPTDQDSRNRKKCTASDKRLERPGKHEWRTRAEVHTTALGDALQRT